MSVVPKKAIKYKGNQVNHLISVPELPTATNHTPHQSAPANPTRCLMALVHVCQPRAPAKRACDGPQAQNPPALTPATRNGITAGSISVRSERDPHHLPHLRGAHALGHNSLRLLSTRHPSPWWTVKHTHPTRLLCRGHTMPGPARNAKGAPCTDLHSVHSTTCSTPPTLATGVSTPRAPPRHRRTQSQAHTAHTKGPRLRAAASSTRGEPGAPPVTLSRVMLPTHAQRVCALQTPFAGWCGGEAAVAPPALPPALPGPPRCCCAQPSGGTSCGRGQQPPTCARRGAAGW
jgi:hypothetical protein